MGLDSIVFSMQSSPEPAPLYPLLAGLIFLWAPRRRFGGSAGPLRLRKHMKTLALALGAWAARSLTPKLHAQGSVFLNNYDSGKGLYVVFEGGSITAAAAGTSVMIFGGLTPASMAPLANSAGESLFTVPPAGVEARGPGSGSYFDVGTGFVPGVPSNGTAFFAIRAWADGPTFSDAQAWGVWLISGVWQQDVGEASAPAPLKIPGTLLLMPSIPEPSTMALAALGLAGWLAFRRCKSQPGA